MATSNLPDYVDRSDNQVLSAPADLENVTLYYFPIPSDVHCQQRLVDKFLNHPSPPEARSDYRAFLPQVFLMFAHNGALRPVQPDRHRGYYSYLECGFWIPTVSFRTVGGISFASHLTMFPYWMFVDESYAMAAGREMQGWFKELARICVAGRCTGNDLPVPDPSESHWSAWDYQPPDLNRFATDVMTPGRDNVGLQEQHRLLDLTRLPGSPGNTDLLLEQFRSLFVDGFKRLLLADGRVALPAPTFVSSGLAAFPFSTSLRFALLKQFYLTGDPDLACYQAGVEVMTRATRQGRRGILPGSYQLKIAELPSHPVVRELGLDQDSFDHIRGFFAEMDFRLETGVERWRKRASPIPPAAPGGD